MLCCEERGEGTSLQLQLETPTLKNPVLKNEQAYLLLLQAKVFGFSDKEIAAAIGSDEITVRNSRLALGIRPEFGEVDTCAGEFEAVTPYYYSYYSFSRGDAYPPAAGCPQSGCPSRGESQRRS